MDATSKYFSKLLKKSWEDEGGQEAIKILKSFQFDVALLGCGTSGIPPKPA